MPCEEAIEKAKAVDLAVTAGAVRDTVQYRYDNEPLAYYHPGNTSRLKIRVAGGLRSE